MKKTIMNSSLMLAAGVVLLATSCKKDAPTISADKTTAEVGELISMNCLAADASLKKSYVTWDFGDAATVTNAGNTALIYNNNNPLVVSHAYGKAGVYTVAAIFNKSKTPTKHNATSTYGSTTITVVAPVADFSASASSVVLGGRVSFTNTSTANGNKIDEAKGAGLTYAWSVKNASTGAVVETAAGRDFSKVFSAGAGTYTVTLWTSQGGSTTAKSTDVSVTGGVDAESSVDKLLGAHSSVMVSASTAGSTTASCNSSASVNYTNVTFKGIAGAGNENKFEMWAVVSTGGDQINGEKLCTVTVNDDGTANIFGGFSDPSNTTLNGLVPSGLYQFTSTGLKYKEVSSSFCSSSYTRTYESTITW